MSEPTLVELIEDYERAFKAYRDVAFVVTAEHRDQQAIQQRIRQLNESSERLHGRLDKLPSRAAYWRGSVYQCAMRSVSVYTDVRSADEIDREAAGA